jgi:hypothetical protein
MPRDIQQQLERGLKWQMYVEKNEEKARRRRPARTRQRPIRGTLFAKRNRRQAIKEGALRRVYIIITYTKITTNETKRYIVAPYSYRFRKLRVGYRKLLFAWDKDDKHIKGFVLRNIQRVALTDSRFKPRNNWPVEF